METVTIPKDEYLELISLYQKITKKLAKINSFQASKENKKGLDAYKFCGTISLNDAILDSQKKMRDEWR